MKEIGQSLKQIREKKGISKYRIYKESKIDYSTINRIENGENVESKKLHKYMELIGVYYEVINFLNKLT